MSWAPPPAPANEIEWCQHFTLCVLWPRQNRRGIRLRRHAGHTAARAATRQPSLSPRRFAGIPAALQTGGFVPRRGMRAPSSPPPRRSGHQGGKNAGAPARHRAGRQAQSTMGKVLWGLGRSTARRAHIDREAGATDTVRGGIARSVIRHRSSPGLLCGTLAGLGPPGARRGAVVLLQ